MNKFFYSKNNDTSQAQQSDNGIILNGSDVKFYKNGVNIKTLSGGTVDSMPAPSSIRVKLPNNIKSKYSQYFTQNSIYNYDLEYMPAGTSVNDNAFTYMKANYAYMDANQYSWPS